MDRLVRFGYVVISCAFESFFCYGPFHCREVGCRPICLSTPCRHPGVFLRHTHFSEVAISRLRLLPLFPDVHPIPSSEPLIKFLCHRLHVSQSVVVQPPLHVEHLLFHDLSGLLSLVSPCQFKKLGFCIVVRCRRRTV